MKKRTILLFAMIVVLFCIPVSAQAYFDLTADDAVAWVLGHSEGVGYEYDGYTGYYDEYGNWVYIGPQCVDLIRGYMDRISGTHTSGNGYSYADNWLPDGYTRVYKGIPQKGDILVWTTGDWGHVAIVTNVESSGKVIYSDQNGYGSALKVAHGRGMWPSSNDYWGIIRPDFKPSIGTIDVNTILDGQDTGAGTVLNGVRYGTFDIYINGTHYNDKDDIAPTECTSYQITDIKPTVGHVYSGAVGSLSGSVAAGQAVTVKLKFDTCTNHTYDSGKVTKAASCTQTGVRTYTCTKCKATKTETIPKLAHTSVIDPAVPATVTTTGLTEGSHCSKCGTVLKAQQVVPKLPRVPNDFDLDGVAEPIMTLPGALTAIQDGAFEGGAAEVIIIPEGVTSIGSRAFANMPKLKIVFMPESVKTISFDAFDGSSNVKLYVQEGSKWGTRLDLPSVEIVSGWVDESKIPAGARVTEERWTYDYVVEGQTKKKKTTSPITEDGWTLEGTSWSSTSTGSQMCVDGYPGGYSGARNYTTDKWSSYENDTTKRTVSTSVSKYIYWHWCWISGYLSSENYNVYISDTPYETDEAGRYYQYFSAFESADNAGHIDPNGVDGGACYYYWRGDPSDGSWWWWRIPVYQQTRVDYQKQYTYTMTIPSVSESRVSSTPVTESDTVRNVKHEVQYSFT